MKKIILLSIVMLFQVGKVNSSNWNNYANVLDFGATINDTNDDVSSFVSAIATQKPIIYVPKGTYTLSNLNPYISLRSNLNIYCEKGAILHVPNTASLVGQTTPLGYNFNPVFGVSDSEQAINNINIENCTFIIEKHLATPIQIYKENSSNISISNIEVDGKGAQSNNKASYGIFINNASNVVIENVSISNTIYDAIFGRLANFWKVSKSTFSYIGINTQYPFHAPSSANLGTDYWNSAAISAPAAKNSLIEFNSFNYTGGAGIILRGGYNSCENNSITNNHFINIGKGAIGIGINSGGTGNSINNLISDNIIQGFMQRFEDSAINVNHRGSSGNISDITIKNNIIDMFAPGDSELSYPNHNSTLGVGYSTIYISPPTNNLAHNVTIADNIIRNALGAAITLEHTVASNISNNNIYNAARVHTGNFVFNLGGLAPYAIFFDYVYLSSLNDNTVKNSHMGYVSGNAPAIFLRGHKNDMLNNVVTNTGISKSAYGILNYAIKGNLYTTQYNNDLDAPFNTILGNILINTEAVGNKSCRSPLNGWIECNN